MPTKLKVLVALMSLSFVLSLVTTSWLGAIFQAVLLVGVLKGHEGARTWLIGAGFLGIVWGIAILVLAVIANQSGQVPLALNAVMVGLGVFGICQSAFFMWCLGQQDVQHWMFKRSMSAIGVEI